MGVGIWGGSIWVFVAICFHVRSRHNASMDLEASYCGCIGYALRVLS
jgi:hypothetical protein